jgi:hypothetical protein
MCVQRFDDSLNSAIHITYRISLRSSSMPEPRDPLLKVLIDLSFDSDAQMQCLMVHRGPPLRRAGSPPRQQCRVTWGWESGPEALHSVMIPPQVHLRRPCYDFYFL